MALQNTMNQKIKSWLTGGRRTRSERREVSHRTLFGRGKMGSIGIFSQKEDVYSRALTQW
jgi:hypothetical protein